jgi:hypothetical protein
VCKFLIWNFIIGIEGKLIRNLYSLHTKIIAILGPSTQTNVRCKMTKIPFVFYEKDLAIVLSLIFVCIFVYQNIIVL